jgi:DNA-binding NtrC family response regulator
LAKRVLIVDDHAGARFGIRDFLEGRGLSVTEADSCQTAEESFRTIRPDVAIVDYSLPDGNAIDLLPKLREIDASVPIIVLTAHGSIDLAVQAMREGAEHFLTKPLDLPTLHIVLQRTLEQRRIRQKHLANESRNQRQSVEPLFGASESARQLSEQAKKVVQIDSPILIQGETGSGKGVLARWVHENGPRAQEAFVDLNCAGLSREFLESELFGFERGAFTGAVTAKQGLLEMAHRGTLFLDEIGDIDPAVQPKLLKVLEEKRFRRMGEVRDRTVDVRLIAATHHDLARLSREKTFRADLYFRISTFPLFVPPLRERKVDIPSLASQLVARFASDFGRGDVELSPDAIAALQAYPWPGNIRELRNVLERAVLLSSGSVLGRRDLPFDSGGTSSPPAAPEESDTDTLTLLEVERRHIERVLNAQRGRVEEAARILGIPRSSLYQKLKKFGISVPRA